MLTLDCHPSADFTEADSDRLRGELATFEPSAQRTYTPSPLVIAGSAGIYHWTPEGQRLFDFTSGVLVANLGHQPRQWMERVWELMKWRNAFFTSDAGDGRFQRATPLTAYNAITPVEVGASRRLIETLSARPGGKRLEQVLWATSGSEAVQKALWTALARDPLRPLILATRHGFHGKKGLAGAVSGAETDTERDQRVHFISFPMLECHDVTDRERAFNPLPYQDELDSLWNEHGGRLGCLITEPYLGAAGSYHPPAAYLQLLERFCRQHDIIFILDEVQSNFGRTRCLFAFEKYGLEPDLVVLGKGLGNGMPVAAVAGPRSLFARLGYGEGSDTYSGHPLGCAAVQATLEAFADASILERSRLVSPELEAGLTLLKGLPFIEAVRGEPLGMVWGIEFRGHRGQSAQALAAEAVRLASRGDPATGQGVHLLGPLAGKVLRVAPPLVITREEAQEACELLLRVWRSLE